MNKREICGVMQQVYSERGPRDAAGHLVPAGAYAAMSDDEVCARWDFDGRFLMHRLAKAIISMQHAIDARHHASHQAT